jgi:hypothetical protein
MDKSTDNLASLALARLFYLSYCKHNKYDPKPAPYVPGWALEYAQVSIDAFGYDSDDLPHVLGLAELGAKA